MSPVQRIARDLDLPELTAGKLALYAVEAAIGLGIVWLLVVLCWGVFGEAS